jgi:CubicO group peptidase (beta-lactamase class C family)
VVGVHRGSVRSFLENGRTRTGGPFTADTVVYTASLSKQITAACAALLVRRGRLDVESALARWMPELPAWAHTVRLRHLIHHTSGLPEYAHENVFGPLDMQNTRYWAGPAPHPPGAAPLEPLRPAPLSLGDGGVWSTARDLVRWNEALHHDELGISARLHTAPGDYAWGIGVRTHAGHRIYRHGGPRPGVTAQLVRVADRNSGFVVLVLADDGDRTAAFADTMVVELTSG